MFLLNWFLARSIRFRIFSILGFILIPVCLLVQLFILPTFKEKIMEGKKFNTEHAVDLAEGIIKKNYADFKENKITEAEAKERSLQAIKSLRYNEKEYFWINDLKPVMIMHPINEKLNNAALNEKKDPNGKFLFMEMVDVVKKHKEGFVEYMWERPGETKPVPKLSFVRGFEPWGWVVGTGIYIDDVENETNALSMKIWSVIAITLFLTAVGVSLFSHHLATTLIVLTGKISSNTTSLRKSSIEIGESSNEVAKRSDTSAAALQQTSASLEEITQMIMKSTDNMEHLQKISNHNKHNLLEGNESFKRLSSNINQINSINSEITNQIEKSNKEISQIANLIHEISDKTKIINDIVFQTKLLSFNASVEAARAGENGKGFAVVAEEVGKLAQMSGSAAKEISDILDHSTSTVQKIIEDTKKSITPLIEKSSKSLDEGCKIADGCAQAFDKIEQDSNRINEMVVETFTAFKEQSIAVEEISKAVESLDVLGQQNADSAKVNANQAVQIQNEANDMAKISNELREIIEGKVA